MLFALYEENMLILNDSSPKFTTSVLNPLTLDALNLHGWKLGMPCNFSMFSPVGTEKELTLTEAKGLSLNVTMALDLFC